MSAPTENQSDARCPYCGCATPEPGMRCRDRAMCAQRADYTYITDALGIKGAREGASPSAPARTGTDRNA